MEGELIRTRCAVSSVASAMERHKESAQLVWEHMCQHNQFAALRMAMAWALLTAENMLGSNP